MVTTWPVDPQCFKVAGGAVALVFGESVVRKLEVNFTHEAVSGDFCDDAGGGDREGKSVAFDDAVVRKWEIFHWEAVDEAVLGGWRDGFRGPAHGEVGGAEDVEVVDFLVVGSGDGPTDFRMGRELLKQGFAAGCGDFF